MSIYGNSAIIGGGGGSGQLGSYLTVYVPSWVTTVSCSINGRAAKQVYSETGMIVYMIVDTGTYTIRGEGSGVSVEKQLPLMNLFSGYVTALHNLEESSWDIISTVSKNGLASDTWNVNDRKNTIIEGVRYEFAIMGFDTYDVVNDDVYGRLKNGITFGMVQSMTFTSKMNSTVTNNGGWGNADLKTACNGYALELSLSNVLVYCKIPYCEDKNSPHLSYDTNSKLFMPSFAEVFGNSSYGYQPLSKEGSQFPYYANGGLKTRPTTWWLRSVATVNNGTFCVALASGTPEASQSQYPQGLSPCFCV